MRDTLLFMLSFIAVVAHAELTEILTNSQKITNDNLSAYKLKPEWARTVTPSAKMGLSVFSFGFTNSTCTGTLISRQGHILTARHCLESAIVISDQVLGQTATPPVEFFNTKELSDNFSIYNFNVPNITKKLEIPVGLDETIVYAKIVGLGQGYLEPRFTGAVVDEKLRQLHQTMSNDGYSVGGDFAIVQIEQLKGLACYRLAKNKPSVGDRVHSIGFPCYKEFGDWPQNRVAQVETVVSSDGAFAENSLRNFYLPRGSFVTDGVAQECNSGTSVMSNSNEIIGVFHTVFYDNEKQQRSVAISTERILELLPLDVRKELLNLNVECEK